MSSTLSPLFFFCYFALGFELSQPSLPSLYCFLYILSRALLTYFSCCYLVNRFGALLSLSICQFPLGGFKVKVLAVHFHITHESFTCMNGHWGLFCSLGTLLSLEDWISDAYQIMIFLYIYPLPWVSFSLFRSLEIMCISKRLRNNFLKGSST